MGGSQWPKTDGLQEGPALRSLQLSKVPGAPVTGCHTECPDRPLGE